MKNMCRKILICVLCMMLWIPTVYPRADENVFYLNADTDGRAARSLTNGSQLPVSHVRYDKFQCMDGTPNTPYCPNLGVGIKYIEGDSANPDGQGKSRYVYCTEFAKLSPAGGITMQFVGWANKKVTYALYYGAVYYEEPCRNASYSTGDWQMDYFVTQMAVHVLNEEFTMEALRRGLNTSSATAEEKEKVLTKIEKIVQDAENAANYGGFTEDNWLDMKEASFSLNGYQDAWTEQESLYVSNGVFHPVFKSYNGYDFCEQLTGYEIQVPEGVTVNRKGVTLYADFDVSVSKNQYRQWQLTGKTVLVQVKASIPRYWGAGIYQAPEETGMQNICFLTWTSAGGNAVFEQSAELHIPKVKQDLTIYKKDGETETLLSGAGFSLWGYDGEGYTKAAGTFKEQPDGSYVCSGIDYTNAENGKFLIREDEAPDGYDNNYLKENAFDEEDYNRYGGRKIQMNEDGFHSENVSEPFVFRDPKKTDPRAFVFRKKILKEEVTWEHGNPTFFFKLSGTDLEGNTHTYHCFVEFQKQQEMEQQGSYLTAEAKISNVPAGIYQAEETGDVLRYVLSDAVSELENVQVEKRNAGSVNGVEKIQALVTADLRAGDGSVTFENRKVLYGEDSDLAVAVNQFILSEEHPDSDV